MEAEGLRGLEMQKCAETEGGEHAGGQKQKMSQAMGRRPFQKCSEGRPSTEGVGAGASLRDSLGLQRMSYRGRRCLTR